MFQTFADNDLKSFEFKSLQETLDEIRDNIDPSNLRYRTHTSRTHTHAYLAHTHPQQPEVCTDTSGMQRSRPLRTDHRGNSHHIVAHALHYRSRSVLSPRSSFQNNVEIHINHIQSGLTQMGNLSAFAAAGPANGLLSADFMA